MWFKTQFKHLLLILQAKYMAFHVLGALSQPLGYQEVFPRSTVKSIVLNSYKGVVLNIIRPSPRLTCVLLCIEYRWCF